LNGPEMRLPILLVFGRNPSVMDYEEIFRVLLIIGFCEIE
jgi:hypothetical protein